MKIVCIGKNYADHIAELNDERPDAPVIFTKPDSALIQAASVTFELPSFSEEVHHEVELVMHVGKRGKNIPREEAFNHIDGLGVGIDFTARDLQRKAKDKGLPWAISKGFDGAACISPMEPIDSFPKLDNLHFKLEVNGEQRQYGDTALMLYPFDYQIHYISQFMTLNVGDLIYTGTPKGVATVHKDDILSAYIEDDRKLHIMVA